MKNILITVSSNRMVRTYLNTYLFYDLVKTNNYFYVFSHQKNMKNFLGNLKNVEPIYLDKSLNVNYFKRLVRRFWDYNWQFKHFPLERFYFNLKYKDFFIYFKITIKVFLSIVFEPIYKLLKNYFWYDATVAKFLKNNNIDRVILTSISLEEDRVIGVTANKLGIPVVIGSDGWDSYLLYNLFINYTKALVWGKPMQEYLKSQLYYDENKIIFTGIPYKDSLLSTKLSKFEIKKKFGIKKNEKVILIFSCGRYSGLGEKLTIQYIERAITCGLLPNCKVVLRLMPQIIFDKWEQYYIDKYANSKNIILQYPDKSYAEVNSESNLLKNNFREAGELYKIADVMINIVSMSLLECNMVNHDCKLILCNYEKNIYPGKSVSKGCVFNSLINSGVCELNNINDLIPTLQNLLYKDNNTSCFLAEEWHFKEENVISKILD